MEFPEKILILAAVETIKPMPYVVYLPDPLGV